MPALPENTPEAKVLVVDDEANIVELLSVSLKFQGFEVYTASNGPAALDKAREVRPDAVILDVEPDASWVAPLIMAATGTEQPAGSIWVLPDDKLVQLLLGLSTLVESSLIVTGHNFGRHGRRQF